MSDKEKIEKAIDYIKTHITYWKLDNNEIEVLNEDWIAYDVLKILGGKLDEI